MDLLGADQGRAGSLAQPQVAHLAGLHQLGHGAHRVFDRHLGIDPVLVVEIEMLDAQPAQTALHRLTHVVGPAIHPTGIRIFAAHQTELAGQEYLLAASAQGSAQQFLVVMRAIGIGGIQQGHAAFQGQVQGGQGLALVQEYRPCF